MTTDQGLRQEDGRPSFIRPQANRQKAARYALTDAELDVLYLLQQGLYDQAIADRLRSNKEAVSEIVAGILGKLDARSRTEAALRAFREGIFP